MDGLEEGEKSRMDGLVCRRLLSFKVLLQYWEMMAPLLRPAEMESTTIISSKEFHETRELFQLLVSPKQEVGWKKKYIKKHRLMQINC